MTEIELCRSELSWSVGHSESADVAPSRFVPATVPGAVQLDWARAEGWPPWWQGSEHRRYRWMEDVFWHYRAQVARPRRLAGSERLVLFCGGVDYACVVRVAGEVLHQHEGMFSPFEIDLTHLPDGVLIEIVVAPAPKAAHPSGCVGESATIEGRWQARQSCKPAVS